MNKAIAILFCLLLPTPSMAYLSFVAGSSQYVNCGDSSSVDFGGGDFAIACWAFTSNNSLIQIIVGKDINTPAGNRQFDLIFNRVAAGTASILYFKATDSSVLYDTPTGTLSVNTWYHIVGQRVGSTLEVYINGVKITGGTSSGTAGTMQSTVANINVGRREYAGSNNYLTGNVDDVRIYNRSLSANEIMSLYSSYQRSWPGSHAVFYRRFDEGVDGASTNSTAIKDIIGDGMTCTAINGPTWHADPFLTYP